MKSSALIIGGRGMVGRQLTKLCSEKFDDVCVIDTAVHRSERNNNVKYIQVAVVVVFQPTHWSFVYEII